MSPETKFTCLRCGHEYVEEYAPDDDVERACPKCRSNSVRPEKVKKKADAAEEK
ncbi:MAG: hypothetical protein JSU81_10160 [Candidatus Coatesbacteria bacterium]|nr:MAG: hypothetical protein JSU81_10160 [Candidatus Coatesbacteria bacterium]